MNRTLAAKTSTHNMCCSFVDEGFHKQALTGLYSNPWPWEFWFLFFYLRNWVNFNPVISKLENWTFLYHIYLQKHLPLKWKKQNHRSFNIFNEKEALHIISKEWNKSIRIVLLITFWLFYKLKNIFHSVSENFINVLGPLFCCRICWQIIIGSLYWNAPCKLRILCWFPWQP